MKEAYLLVQDLCPEGQALSDMLLVANGLALREQRPENTSFVHALCLTGVSTKRNLYSCLAPPFLQLPSGYMVWLWWPMGLMLTIPQDRNQQKKSS